MPSLDDIKKKARDFALDAGLASPTALEKLERGVKSGVKEFTKKAKSATKGVREELGIPSSLGEKVEEAAKSALEGFGLKEPRVGKSLVDVIKGAFGMIAALSGPEAKQTKALEKFDKSCENFVKAMKGLFKTINQEHAHKPENSKPKAATKSTTKVQAKSTPVKARPQAKSGGWGR